MSDKPNYRHSDYAIRDRILQRLRTAKALETWCVFCPEPHKIRDADPGAPPTISHGCCEKAAKQWLEDARTPLENEQ